MIKTDVPTDEWRFSVEIHAPPNPLKYYWLTGDAIIPCDRFGWIRVEDALPVGDIVKIEQFDTHEKALCVIWRGHIHNDLFSKVITHWRPRRGPIV